MVQQEAEIISAKRTSRPRCINRGALAKHLSRLDKAIEPESLIYACDGCLHCIGEDVSERLDVFPPQICIIVTHRPKYACRACSDGIVQGSTPARLIPTGLPTEAMVAHALISKYANHLPFYRLSQIMVRQSIDIDRSTLAHQHGWIAYELQPVFDALLADLKRSNKLFMDETHLWRAAINRQVLILLMRSNVLPNMQPDIAKPHRHSESGWLAGYNW